MQGSSGPEAAALASFQPSPREIRISARLWAIRHALSTTPASCPQHEIRTALVHGIRLFKDHGFRREFSLVPEEVEGVFRDFDLFVRSRHFGSKTMESLRTEYMRHRK